MRIWKQLLLSVVVLCLAAGLWVWLVPGAGAVLEKLGLPGPVVAAIKPGETKADDAKAANGNAGGRNGGRATLVVTRPVADGTVNDRLNAIGNGEAIVSVVITPQVAGTISEIHVNSGEKVKKGQLLARLDNAEQVIARNRAEVGLKSAAEKSQLYRTIKSSVSRMDVFDAEIAEETARLELDTANFNLKRREIIAPIDGIIGIVPVSVGDNVGTETMIVTLDDRTDILVDFWVPERFITAVTVGSPVEATSIAQPGQVFAGVVEAVDNRLDAASRTMRVRARIGNEADTLRAGMSFAVAMRFAGETYPAIDPLAVQWDSDGAFAWKIADDKAAKVRVSVIQRNPDAVLVKAELKSGDAIAVEGLLRLRDGGAVREQKPAQQQAEATP